ncbi:MAG: hypothetical protein ACOYL5_20575 [Phototrophicaceae bacterium]|jgi:hypothetical protein
MNGRFVQVLIGGILVLAGIGGVTDGNFGAVFLGLLGFYLIARQFEENRFQRLQRPSETRASNTRANNTRSSVRPPAELQEDPTKNPNHIYAHALDAVRAAGVDPTNATVLPVDIGVFAMRGNHKPRIYRTNRIPDDVDYIQPFVMLRLPMRAKGKITFEVVDDVGRLLFVREEEHDLQRGRNLVVPAARLPIHDAHDPADDSPPNWHVRVLADGVLLALHNIAWYDSEDSILNAPLADDGEISNELRAALEETELTPMSLDELLSEPPAQQQARR